VIRRELRRPLVVLAEELDRLDADWAIGGATALGIHGYERATRDVDVFAGDDVREDLLDRLRDRGQPLEEVFPPVHYAFAPRARDPDVRIDLLFPALGVESLGLMAARRARIAGRDMPVVPLAHLVAAKLTVDPEEDRDRHLKDQQDLRALWVRGLIDVRAVQRLLEDVGDREAMRRLHELAGSPG
jgi:hypothetical protein